MTQARSALSALEPLESPCHGSRVAFHLLNRAMHVAKGSCVNCRSLQPACRALDKFPVWPIR